MGCLRHARRRLAAAISPKAEFNGAIVNRLTRDWVFASLTADAEVMDNLYTLRGRCRELAHNNSWAARYLSLASSNVFGADGIVLQAKLGRRDLETSTESAWRHWGREVTADGRLTALDVWRLADQNRRIDGECFIRKLPGFDNDFRFAVQFIDPDQLDETYNRPRSPGENEIRLGVEVDLNNRPVAYHFWRHAEGDIHRGVRERERVPAGEIVHYYRQYRPNQTRGLPELVPIMSDLNMLRGYVEAELVAARFAAAKTGFFESDADAGATVAGTETGKLRINAEPGTLEQLPPGMRFTEWDPKHPTDAFPEFVRTSLQSIASGLGVSYTSLTSDLKQASFASSRVGLLSERDMWRVEQRFAIDHLVRPMFEAWVPMAWLAGQLDTRMNPMAYMRGAMWQARGWDWVDPLKDVQAAVMAKNNRITSTQIILNAHGRDIADVYDDHRREMDLAEEMGVPLIGGAQPVAPITTDDELDAHEDELLRLVAK